MAHTLEEIYLTRKNKYSMELVAGQQGMKAIISWVHTVESEELVPFLKRRELVVITGIRIKNDEELISLVKKLQDKNIAGIIINIGPYIEHVPQELITFCDQKEFPLFTIPWEIRLVELSHDICRSIFENEKKDESIVEAFLDGMLFADKREESLKKLSRQGFEEGTVFQLFACKISGGMEEKFNDAMDNLYYFTEKILNEIGKKYILLIEKKMLHVVLADYHPEEVKFFAKAISDIQLHYGYKAFWGINPATSDFEQLAQYFEKTDILLQLAQKRDLHMAYYENLEIYKLLLSVNNRKVLEDYHKNTVGKLKEYDRLNQTDLFHLLCRYFSSSGKIQNLAEENYVHRNTIHYQLTKIEKIMGIHLENWDDRIKIHLSLLIDELL